MLRIQRTAQGQGEGQVRLQVSGRIQAEHVVELQRLLESEAPSHAVTIDLKDVTLVDRDVIAFLARCEHDGTTLANCPPYVREWITSEGDIGGDPGAGRQDSSRKGHSS